MIHDKPFVKIIWHDAQDDGRTWVAADEIAEFANATCEVTSWGWAVASTKKYVTLAADYIHDGATYGRITKIPRGMIVSIEEFHQE